MFTKGIAFYKKSIFYVLSLKIYSKVGVEIFGFGVGGWWGAIIQAAQSPGVNVKGDAAFRGYCQNGDIVHVVVPCQQGGGIFFS